MAYFVYILYSKADRGLYVGYTRNTEKRLARHNAGYVKATQSRRPLELIHKEIYKTKTEAFNRERFLKSSWSARFKQKILKDYINKVSHD